MPKNTVVQHEELEVVESTFEPVAPVPFDGKLWVKDVTRDESGAEVMSIGLFYALRKPIAKDANGNEKGGAQADETLRKLATNLETCPAIYSLTGKNVYNLEHVKALQTAYIEYRKTHASTVRYAKVGYKALDVRIALEANGLALPESKLKGAYETFSWAIGKHTLSPDAFESACKRVYAERQAIAKETHSRLLTAGKV